MKNVQSNSNFLCGSLFVLLIFFNLNLTGAQETEDEREFDYVKGSQKGPDHWGDIKKEWAACNNGTMQSPIDLLSHEKMNIVPNDGKIDYEPSNATIKNRGHDIMVQWHGDAGSMFINGTEYSLKQAHWHSPSEHAINGKRYDLELHLVHQSINETLENNVAVLSVLYKIGKPDEFLTKLMKSISTMVDQEDVERHVEVIDPTKINISNETFFRYTGSLTTPPCTEGVIWTVNKKVRTVSKEQVKLLREAVHDSAESNARPLQPHNDRSIYLMMSEV